jgi:TRAP-type C4-dicarboxylate transport system substrate-binding protein
MMKASILVLGLLAAGSAAHAQTVLSVSNWTGPGQTQAVKAWCDLLDNKSSGKLKCNILPRPVSSPPGSFDAVANGIVDVSLTVHGYTPNRFVLTQMAEFPFNGDSAEAMSVAYDKVASRHPEFAREHKGVHVLGYFTHGPGMVFNSKRQIAKIEDLEGLKFRVGGGMVNEIAKSLGMNVTLKPASDAYELLSGGVMDGALFPAESIEAYKLDKVIRYATSFPGGLYNLSWVFMMNPARYEKLSADEKRAVDSVSGEVLARIFGRQWDSLDRSGRAHMQASKIQVTMADPGFVAAVKARTSALEQKWVQDASARGTEQPGKILAEFRKEVAALHAR